MEEVGRWVVRVLLNGRQGLGMTHRRGPKVPRNISESGATSMCEDTSLRSSGPASGVRQGSPCFAAPGRAGVAGSARVKLCYVASSDLLCS